MKNEWMDGWMDGWMNEWNIHLAISSCLRWEFAFWWGPGRQLAHRVAPWSAALIVPVRFHVGETPGDAINVVVLAADTEPVAAVVVPDVYNDLERALWQDSELISELYVDVHHAPSKP